MRHRSRTARHSIAVAALIVVGIPTAIAAGSDRELSDADRSMIVHHAEHSRDVLLDEVRDLRPDQWNFRAGADRWTIAEIVEHVILAENLTFDFVTGELVKRAPDAAAERVEDGTITAAAVNRTRRLNAPEVIRPTGRWSAPDELLAEFNKVRSRTISYLKTTHDDLRGATAPHPVLGKPFDGLQWLLTASSHTERHTLQIREVKADASYPK